MDFSAEMRRCLEDVDVPGVLRLWQHLSPHLPQPATDADALAALHMARTSAGSMPLRARAYSHRWLYERNLPSQLPDHLKPSAERLYPRIAEGVGVCVRSAYPEVKRLLTQAMEGAVLDVYADAASPDPHLVTSRMAEARFREMRSLGLSPR